MMSIAVLSLLATACLSVSQSIVVDEDGSGSLESRVELGEELLGFMLMSGEAESVSDACAQVLEDMVGGSELAVGGPSIPERSSTEITATDEECFAVYSESWPAGGSPSEDVGVDLFVADGSYRVEIPFGDEMDDVLPADLDEMEAAMGMMGIDESMQLALEISLPGEPAVGADGEIVSNADSVDGTTFVWEMGLEDMLDAPDMLYAESTTASEGSSYPAVLAVLSLVLLAAAAAVAVRARTKRRAAS